MQAGFLKGIVGGGGWLLSVPQCLGPQWGKSETEG